MTVTYPSSYQALAKPGPTTYRDDAGYELDVLMTMHAELLEAIQTKLGTGASTAAANQVLRATGAGASAFGAVQTGDLAANAVTQVWTASPSTSSPAYASASMAVIAEMSVSITSQGGPLLLLYFGTHFGSVVGTTWIVQPFLDGVAFGAGIQQIITNVNYHFGAAYVYFTTPAAGAHTIDMRQSIGGGGGIVAYSTWRQFSVIELKR